MSGTLERLAQPGIRMMQRLHQPAKFLLITIAFMVPLGVSLYAVVNYANVGIEFAASEQTGTAYLKLLNPMLSRVVADSRNGTRLTDRSEQLAALQTLVDRDRDALKIQGALLALSKAIDNQDFTAQLLKLYTTIGDNSNLILDPDLDSYYTMTVAVDYGPKLLDASAQLAQRVAKPSSGAANSTDIRYLAARIAALQESAEQAVQRAAQANPEIAKRLDTEALQHSLRQLLGQAVALEEGGLVVAPAALSGMAQTAAEQSLQLSNASVAVLDELLQKRINGLAQRRNFILVLTLSCLMVCCYLITSFYLCNLRGFEALVLRMNKLANGDLTINYPARGNDVIGVLINAFNGSRAQLQVLV